MTSAAAPAKIKGTSLTTPTSSLVNHSLVLGQLKETTEIAQRLRGDPLDSFVRVGELNSALGTRFVNGTIQAPNTTSPITGTVSVTYSITGTGSPSSPLQLVGDAASPGNNMIYSTNGSGVKGWYANSGAGVTSITAGAGLGGGTITTTGTITLDLTYSPTWTGNHTWTPTSGTGATYNGLDNQDAAIYNGSATVGKSFGLFVKAGTNSSDSAMIVRDAPNTNLLLRVAGDGSVIVGAAAGGVQGRGTINVTGGYYINGSPLSFNRGAGWNSSSGAVQLSLVVPIDVVIPYACTLQEVDIITQGGSGSCTVNVWKAASLAAPTSANDITGGTPPAISGGTSYTNTTLTGWTTAFAQNDRVRFTLTANTNFTTVEIILRLK